MVDQWLTVPEVAKRLGIARQEAYNMVASGEIPAKRLSPRRIRISEKELQDWVAAKEDAAIYSSAP